MNCLVTGGAGFIGSHLVELLVRKGHHVRVLDDLSTGRIANVAGVSDDIQISNLSINSPESAALYEGVDSVFHLAAKADIVPSIVNPIEYMKTNLDGTLCVLENCRKFNVGRIVYAASSSCYGIARDLPTSENARIDPQYPYALSKWMGEEAALHWGRLYGLEVVSLRLFNVFGPRARTTGNYGAVMGVFLAQHLGGQPLTIVGDGEQTRDFVFVADVARAFLAAAETSIRSRVFNIGSGRPVSVNYLANLIGGATVHIPDRPGEPRVTHADISRATKEITWSARTSFEDGMRLTLEHRHLWKDAPIWTPDTIAVETKEWFRYLS